MRVLILVAFTVFMTSSATSNDLFSGENLIQPMPLPEDSWVAYEKQDGSVYTRMWAKNDRKDQLMTSIFRRTPNRSVIDEKSIDDESGKEKCKSFNASESSSVIEHGYSSLTWRSSCSTGNGSSIVVLHKAISGRDSFYHIRRIWNSGYTQEQMELWKKYFLTIYTCDTRSTESNSCPGGYSQVN
ncbi:MAG TPA: hypothetical protein ENI05_04510 [Porticoccus sp.]|nr:hypothetical protein [Porticoccus sp.]